MPAARSAPHASGSINASRVKRVSKDNGLFAIRPSRNNIDWHFYSRLDIANIGTSVFRQFVEAFRADSRFSPSGQIFVDWLELFVAVYVHQTARRAIALPLVTYAHADCF